MAAEAAVPVVRDRRAVSRPLLPPGGPLTLPSYLTGGWLYGTDAFDPASAEDFGVELDRVLWARPRSEPKALRCAECLLQTEGFPLVLLDFAGPVQSHGHVPWIRLARLAASTRTALIVLSRERITGSQAEIALAMQPVQARFRGTPSLLEGVETSAVLVRHRAVPGAGEVTIQWAGSFAA